MLTLSNFIQPTITMCTMILSIASTIRNKLTVFTAPVVKAQPSLSCASFFCNKLSNICPYLFKFSFPLCCALAPFSCFCLVQIFIISTTVSFLNIFSLSCLGLSDWWFTYLSCRVSVLLLGTFSKSTYLLLFSWILCL